MNQYCEIMYTRWLTNLWFS